MPTRYRLVVAALMLIGSLLAGCDTLDDSKRGACDYTFSRLLPTPNSYFPKEGDQPEEASKLFVPAEASPVPRAMPKDPGASPYLEKAVLGFYEYWRDKNKLMGLMTDRAIEGADSDQIEPA